MHVCAKEGWTSTYIHGPLLMYYGYTLGRIIAIQQLLHEFISYWNFEYTKAVTQHCTKVGGGMDQGPATQVTHLRLNQPSSFCNVDHVAKVYIVWFYRRVLLN